MKFPRYASYRDAAVGWAGLTPAHWEAVALKRIASLRSGDAITADEIQDAGEFPVYGGNGLRGFTSRFTHEGEFALVGRQGALCGNVNYTSGKFWASEHAVVVRPVRPVVTRWLGEVLRAMNLNQYSVSAAQPGLSVEAVSRLVMPFPPVEEQVAIAAFLDRETAKIDALVEEQKRLIELLKEKRQAVISQAVTKGLDPSVPMKDSGVAWLGKVPAHWTQTRIKHLTVSLDQGWSPQCEGYPVQSDTEWGVLKVGCVNGGTFNPDENKSLPVELEPAPDLGVYAGDLLVSRANTRELVGSAAVLTRDHPNLLLCDKLYRIRFDRNRCMPDFVGIFLGSLPVRGQIELAASGASSSMLNIGQSTILDLEIALPAVTEQTAIVTRVSKVCDDIDGLVDAAESTIALLTERRSALISAAVTGKIDVRSLAPH